MIVAFDDGPDDLARLADAMLIAHLQRRYVIAEPGYRRQRLAALRRAVHAILARDVREGEAA